MIRSLLRKIFFHVSSITFFLFISIYAVLTAYGYKVDLDQMEFVSTSVLSISTIQDNNLGEVRIWLDHELISQQSPFLIRDIKSGVYSLLIEKNGFLDWEKEIDLTSDFVVDLHNIFLIPKNYQSLSELVMSNVQTFAVSPNSDQLVVLHKEEALVSLFNLINQDFKSYKIPFIAKVVKWKKDNTILIKGYSSQEFVLSEFVLENLKLESMMTGFFKNTVLSSLNLDIKNDYEVWDAVNKKILFRSDVILEKLIVVPDSQYLFLLTVNGLLGCDNDFKNCTYLTDRDKNTEVFYFSQQKTLYYILFGDLYSFSFLSNNKIVSP